MGLISGSVRLSKSFFPDKLDSLISLMLKALVKSLKTIQYKEKFNYLYFKFKIWQISHLYILYVFLTAVLIPKPVQSIYNIYNINSCTITKKNNSHTCINIFTDNNIFIKRYNNGKICTNN